MTTTTAVPVPDDAIGNHSRPFLRRLAFAADAKDGKKPRRCPCPFPYQISTSPELIADFGRPDVASPSSSSPGIGTPHRPRRHPRCTGLGWVDFMATIRARFYPQSLQAEKRNEFRTMTVSEYVSKFTNLLWPSAVSKSHPVLKKEVGGFPDLVSIIALRSHQLILMECQKGQFKELR
ncbi:hypothetical protein AKJ16_DCAP15984 [Drosera capensis]